MRNFLLVKIFTIILLPAVALVSWSVISIAQTPPSFDISLTPQTDYAVAGQPFAYTVTITNTGAAPLSDVVVKIALPQGTSFLRTEYTNPSWMSGGLQRGETGEFFWLTEEAINPNEAVTFDLYVEVLPNKQQELVNNDYTVTTREDIEQVIASGPSIRTSVLTPTPTPTPTPSPTSLPTPAPLPTETPLPAATQVVAQSTATLTYQPNGSATPVQVTVAQESQTRFSPLTLILGGVALLFFATVAIGLVWFFKRR